MHKQERKFRFWMKKYFFSQQPGLWNRNDPESD